jgi:iron complex transport system permease protein
MGFYALYMLTVTATVYFLGAENYLRVPDTYQFLLTLFFLITVALLLFGTLLLNARDDLIRLVLTGAIFSVLFRSLTPRC